MFVTMKRKTTIKLLLSDAEKRTLRAGKLKIAELLNFAVDELAVLLDVPLERAKEIHALAEFQTIPSIGIKFAEDLISLGCYSVSELKETSGAALLDEYEFKKGYRVDPCVEDQFRLAVHYAITQDVSRNWWDFTKERKAYREKNGYPANRPKAPWHEHR